jgi:C1A family cysteine protease
MSDNSIINKIGIWNRSTLDDRDYKFTLTADLLSIVDLTPQFTFPVFDQGQIGACTANALTAAFEFDRIKHNQLPPFTPSRLFIYYNARVIEDTVEYDNGASIRSGIQSLRQKGVCMEELWPYVDTPASLETDEFPLNSKPVTKPPDIAYLEASKYIITKYERVDQTLDALRTCIASGYPFAFGMLVFDSWEINGIHSTIIPIPTRYDKDVGGHAVVAVGYDNNTKLFKFRNSWGPNKGDNGYFYIHYDHIINPILVFDFWVIYATEN